MGRLRAAILAVLLLTVASGPAAAAGAIAYSAVDEYYGWAAGYNSASRARAEALDGCQSGGGQDCRPILDCPGGWGSIAYADDSATGIGIACNLKSATVARTFALALCLAVSNALCWTASTFDANGDELPESSNEPFDMAFYTQEMLTNLGFYDGAADGQFGAQSREALSFFQKAIGWEPDGELDWEIFWVLMDMNGGAQAASAAYSEYAEDMKLALPDVTFSYGAAPFPKMTFSEEIARRADNWRRQALAAQLVYQGQDCTIPAVMAEAIPPDGTGGWHVRCAEGDYTIVMDTRNVIVMPGFGEIRSDATGVTVIPPGADPVSQQDPAPATPPSRSGSKLGP